MEAMSGDKWSYKSCKNYSQNVTINKPTPSFFSGPGALPVAQPTVPEHLGEIICSLLCQLRNSFQCYTA